jgi:hypothetical protein
MTAVWRRRRRAARASERFGLRSRRLSLPFFLIGIAALSRPDVGRAQGDQWGRQAQADAASRAIVLAVQQGISALPPTSGQSLVYEYDPATDVFVRSERLGPTSLRAPETIGEGNFIIRSATSYFDLSTAFGPIDYRLNFDDPTVTPNPVFAKLGTEIDAKVGVFDLSMTYGITQNIEVNFNLPIVVVDAQAGLTYTADPTDPGNLGFRKSPEQLNQAIKDGEVVLHTAPFSQLGVSFNDGTHAGVGRISLGTKALVYFREPFSLAAACDFYFPSPSQAEFAGSDSASILPRLIGGARLAEWMRLLVDAGYDYDFDVGQLRRFVWDVGLSFPLAVGTFDLGVGGSKYNEPIDWIPGHASVSVPLNFSLTALGDNQTGTNYVDFLAGAKVRLSDAFILSGAVNVPVTNAGLQPIVGGTVALEYRF